MLKKFKLGIICAVLAFSFLTIQSVSVSADIDFSSLNDILGISDTSQGYDTNIYGKNRNADDFVESWYFEDEASDIQLDNDVFTTNGASTVAISFDLSHLPAFPDSTNYSDDSSLEIMILDPDNQPVPVSEGKINGKKAKTYASGEEDSFTFYPYDLSIGKNVLSVKAHFTKRGAYILCLHINNIWNPKDLGCEFKVKKGSSEAQTILSTDKAIYKTGSSIPVTISYSVEDDGYNYYMYIVEPDDSGINISEGVSYESDEAHIMKNHDWYSSAGELDMTVGKIHKITDKLNLKKEGTYAVVLYNTDLKVKTAVSTFLVSDLGAALDIDPSSVKNGVVLFSCTASATHLSLDSEDKLTLKVQMPFNYDSLMSDIKYDNDSNIEDNGKIQVSVYYTPSGSDIPRKIMSLKNLTGFFTKHTVTLKAADILEAIVATNVNDTSYAGIVSVHFDYDGLSGIYGKITHETFNFSVAKNSKLVKAKAKSSKVPRDYGEKAAFYVESTAGGTIYADIYKGSKKLATVKAPSALGTSADDNASGYVYWNLKNSSGKYCSTGSYTAKLYTKVVLTVINGEDTVKNTVKSNVKTVKFSISKSTGTLKLKAAAVSSAGGNYVTYENPIVGISTDVTVGSKITVKLKNPSGSVFKTYTYEQGKGSDIAWLNLSNLDSNFKIGKYTATVTAKTLGGASKSASCSINVKKSPKVNISGTSLNASDGIGTISFTTSQASQVSVKVKDSNGNIKLNVLDKYYSAGSIKASFSYGSLAVGTYNVTVTATNSGGTSSDTRSFTVKAKPVVVKKPTLSNVRVKWTSKSKEDALKIDVDYTGKGSKIYIEVLWNDAEEIVYTYTTTAAKDSGTVSYTWDGYKANGFRASSGSYTIRAYAVNSAGKTDFVRQNFTIGEG